MKRASGAAVAALGAIFILSGCGGAGSPLVAGSSASEPDIVSFDSFGTTYEIFVYSFSDSDGDGVGDINGITEKLDYLNDGDAATRDDLGVNALWLTPIFPSPTYHKYDATDYYSVDPEFGTMDDLEALLDACHERGMRLYLDLAVNHTSVEHPWFKEEADYRLGLSDEPYDPDSFRANHSLYNFSTEKKEGYEELPGSDGAWFYEARFWSGMPDLDLDDEGTRAEIAYIVKFWLDKGVDGFRLDAVTSYYTDDQEKNLEFLSWLNDTVKGYKSDAYLVAEAWENQDAYSKLYESGVDSFFDFAFAGQEGKIAQAVRGGKGGLKLAKAFEDEEELYSSFNADFINAPFYTNHDMARSAGYYSKDAENRIKTAQLLNLMQGGNAFIYYGEELGMRGSGADENKRAPFPWGDGDAHTTAGPEAMEDFDSAPYGTLLEQSGDDSSIYSYCREAVHLRARHPLIARGRTVASEALSTDSVCAFYKREGDGPENGDLLILVNLSDETQTVNLGAEEFVDAVKSDWELADSLSVSGEAPSLKGLVLTLPGYGTAVLE